jgi:NAD(P) transhydrogenase
LGAIGLKPVDDQGHLQVDDNYQTVVAGVYAAGDVIGFPGLAATAMEQGRVAACHAFGVPANTVPAHFPFGIYTIPELSMVGNTERELGARNIPYETGRAPYRDIARAQILGDANGFIKILFHTETHAILGVHVIGEGATELVHLGQAVMSLSGGLEYLRDAVFNYPTLAEGYKIAALDGFDRLAHR